MTPDARKRDGMMLVVSSPSGAGKTSLTRALLKKYPDVRLSISVTTRPPRKNERGGIDYHFANEETFQTMVDRGEFLEYADVFNHRYGTPKQPVQQALADGFDVLFDIDWNGTQQLKKNANVSLVTVFILPPDAESLYQRLQTRALDSADTISYRMRQAGNELSHYHEYDYVIINDELPRATAQLEHILTAERSKRLRIRRLDEFVGKICDDITRRHA